MAAVRVKGYGKKGRNLGNGVKEIVNNVICAAVVGRRNAVIIFSYAKVAEGYVIVDL